MVDLGKSPLCESFLSADRLERMEPFYPLHVRVCTGCWLAQLPAFVTPDEIFTEYAYFSAYSDSWVEHARAYVEMITSRLALDAESLVVELASNDGYLLQHFLPRGVPVLGIDPAANVAQAAEERGVPTLVEFFGVELAERLRSEGREADLVVGNNVLAQVPDLNDFVRGVAILLARNGTATFEFPHLARLLEGLQYDTIYHEHFGYFTLATIREVFAAHGLAVVDVEELPSHGGSLRVYAAQASAGREPAPAVASLVAREEAEGLRDPDRYRRFTNDVEESKRALLELLIDRAEPASRSSGTARRGRATRCSTTAASGRTSSTTPSIATRTNTAGSRRERRSRSSRPSGSPRQGPTRSSSCRGTSRRRSPRNSPIPMSGERSSSSRSRALRFSNLTRSPVDGPRSLSVTSCRSSRARKGW